MNTVIIQARTGSNRLPNKVLKKIMGKSILEHIFDSVKFSKLTDEIIVATTLESSDDRIYAVCRSKKIECFRGDTNDVLSRFYECSSLHKTDLIIRLTADDPLVDPFLLDQVIINCVYDKFEYSSNLIKRTFPYGYSSGEGIKFNLLKKLHNELSDPLDREHVTRYILNNPHLFKIKNIESPKLLARPNWRLTVDYQEDLELMEKIFSKIYSSNSLISYSNLVKFLDSNKQLLSINEKYN